VSELQPHGVDAAGKSEESLRWIASIHLSRTRLFPRGSPDSPLGEVPRQSSWRFHIAVGAVSADRDMEANNRGGGVRALVRASVVVGTVLASTFSCLALPPHGVGAVSCLPRWPSAATMESSVSCCLRDVIAVCTL
jgi:hypothetical protein